MNSKSVIELKNVFKTYNEHDYVLDDVNLTIYEGEKIVICGESGSGKSTLLNLIGLLDTISSGEYLIEDINVKGLKETRISQIRNQKIGFIFQAYHLIPNLTVEDNLLVPILYGPGSRIDLQKFNEKLDEILDMLGISYLKHQKVEVLSGGEKQRVSIGRTLIANSEIILADEPTGNLDPKNKMKITEILKEISEKYKKTLIIVTHDPDVMEIADRCFIIEGGKLIEKK